MTVKVVDASAIAAILFGEPGGDEMVEALDGAALSAPQLLRFEITNVCLKKLRVHPEKRDNLLFGIEQFDALNIDFISAPQLPVLLVAEQWKLSAYDGAYLWLALELEADLVTLDQKLWRAAKAASQSIS